MLFNDINQDHVYPLHFKIYALTGFWKIKSTYKWKQFFFDIYFYAINISFLFLTFVLVVDAYLVKNDLEKLSTNLYSSITCVGTVFKIWVLMKERERVEGIRDRLDKNLGVKNVGESEDDREIFVKSSRELCKITIVQYTLGVSLFLCWTFFPLLDDERKRSIFPFPLPRAGEPTYYEIVFVYHAVMLLIIAVNVLTYDLIFYGFLIRICAQFDILARNILKINELYSSSYWKKITSGYNFNDSEDENHVISDNNRREQTISLIKHSVIHHRAIMREIKTIDEVYQLPIFLQITCGAALIGIVAFGIITQSSQSNMELMQRLFYVGAALYDIMLYCSFGTKVVEKNNDVKEALYDNPWYEMDTKITKFYLIIIGNVQRKPRITGWGMFTITLGTYLDLLKISYNLTALLKGARSRVN